MNNAVEDDYGAKDELLFTNRGTSAVAKNKKFALKEKLLNC